MFDKDTPAACYQFPPSAFPIKIEFFREDNKKVVWTKILEAPKGDALGQLHIPALAKQEGCLIGSRITWGDGRVHEMTSADDKED
jgi:hypothetical protein